MIAHLVVTHQKRVVPAGDRGVEPVPVVVRSLRAHEQLPASFPPFDELLRSVVVRGAAADSPDVEEVDRRVDPGVLREVRDVDVADGRQTRVEIPLFLRHFLRLFLRIFLCVSLRLRLAFPVPPLLRLHRRLGRGLGVPAAARRASRAVRVPRQRSQRVHHLLHLVKVKPRRLKVLVVHPDVGAVHQVRQRSAPVEPSDEPVERRLGLAFARELTDARE